MNLFRRASFVHTRKGQSHHLRDSKPKAPVNLLRGILYETASRDRTQFSTFNARSDEGSYQTADMLTENGTVNRK